MHCRLINKGRMVRSMNSLYKNIVSDRLKSLRMHHNLTQQEVADKINVERSTYAYYESGKTVPSIDTLLTLSEVYDVPIDYFVGKI